MARQTLPNRSAPLRLYLLGSFRLERAGQSLRLPTHKTESLLAYLALCPKEASHSREKLAALLWGDSPDALARSSLRRALVLLRRALGEDLLVASREDVQVDPAYPLWVDAIEFQAQAERLLKDPDADPNILDIDLYRDDLLVNYYDEWIPPLRDHFRSLFLESLLKLAERARMEEEYDHAAELARTILQRDAANETAHQHLMFSYWKMGKRRPALNQYQACKRTLEQDLGVEPSAETTALYNRIREQASASPEIPEPQLPQLPIPLTTFVGRARELDEIKSLLPTTRLLTLTGAGGSGKTRLSVQVAVDLQSDFAGGVGWVDLAKLIDAALLPQRVAQALGVFEAAGRPLMESIANYLRHRPFLLVLDNCEHVVEACAELVEALLRTCPQLTILATSRQILNVAGETAWIVPSLAMPSAAQPIPSQIEPYEAIQLFVERARAAQPSFRLTAQSWQAVDRICRHLDGIPLAIELAAARIKVLTVGEIEAHLDERFQLLAGGNRTAPPRHRTLRATMDWSYELLSEPEKTLLRRLAVFPGGFTFEAATHVCAREPLDSADSLMLLSSLADKSLLLVREREGTTLYYLLETVRQYALERLLGASEGEQFYERHMDYMLELAARAQPKLIGPEQKVWLHRLEVEQDNFRAALHRSLENPNWLGKSVRLASLLWRYWWYRGEMSEGRSWLERLLTAYSVSEPRHDPKARVEALGHLAHMTWLQDDLLAAGPLLEETAKISQELQETEIWAYSLAWLSMMANDQVDYELAWRRAEESIRLFRQADDLWGMSYAMFVRGRAALSLGDLEDARSFYEASAANFQRLGDRWGMALPIGHLGVIAYRQGDYAAARRLFGERLSIAREFQSKQLICFALAYLAQVSMRAHEEGQARRFLVEGLPLAQEIGSKAKINGFLDGFAELAGLLEQDQRAVRLFAAVQAQRQGLTLSRDSQEQHEYEERLKGLKSRMGERRFAEVWAAGQAMSLEEAIQYALNPA